MSIFADLELSLRRQGENIYSIQMRFNAPGSDADRRLISEGDDTVHVDPEALKAFEPDWTAYGVALRNALFFKEKGARTKAGDEFAGAVQTAKDAGAIFRMRLVIEPNARKLDDLHWETFAAIDSDAPMFTSERNALSRYIFTVDRRPFRSRPRNELKALVAIASPGDIASYDMAVIDAQAETASARASLGEIFPKMLTGPAEATLANIITELRNDYDILYLVCHGVVRDEPRLFLVDGKNEADIVSAEDLIEAISELPERPRLVVLASCQSAGKGLDGLGESKVALALGPRLAQAGVPAVIAMRGNIGIDTATAFFRTFFSELRRDGQIDRAMSVARGVVKNNSDYWIPVLFLRLRSGRIFQTGGGASQSFEQWGSICDYVATGDFVPIVGPELSELVFGDEVPQKLADEKGYPMAAWEINDGAKVAQYIWTNESTEGVRRAVRNSWIAEARRRFPDCNDPALSPRAFLDRVVDKLMAKSDNPYRILAELQSAPLYVNANADPLLELALRKVGRAPVEQIPAWRDETLTEADPAKRVGMNEPEPNAANPTLFYAFGKITQEESWVLTEDDFFDYLIRTSRYTLTPIKVTKRLISKSLMFLGFPLDDWKFRVLFRLIFRQEGSRLLEKKSFNHVGVQVNPDETSMADAMRAKRYLERYFVHANVNIYWGTAEEFLRDLQLQYKRHQATKPAAAAQEAAASGW